MCQEERAGVFSASGLAHGALGWPRASEWPDMGTHVSAG